MVIIVMIQIPTIMFTEIFQFLHALFFKFCGPSHLQSFRNILSFRTDEQRADFVSRSFLSTHCELRHLPLTIKCLLF